LLKLILKNTVSTYFGYVTQLTKVID